MMKIFFKIIVVSLLLSPALVSAQLGGFSQGFTPNYADEMTVEFIPTYPEPGEKFSLNLKMYTENLESSEISWFKDGVLVLNGIGETSYSFIAPQTGSVVNIKISVKTLNGISFSKTVVVNPASVDLIWEAYSYTPPFYKGKALFPPQGSVKILAVPNFRSGASPVNPAKLIYKWTINGAVAEDQSGYGKNIVFIEGNLLGRPIETELLVTDPYSNLVAQNYMIISPTDPELIFYEDNPLYGIIYEQSIKEADLASNEISVLATPYHISSGFLDNIRYSWRVNNFLSPEISGRLATFRRPDGAAGSSLVSLSVENSSKILQSAKSSFLVKFDNNSNVNF